jgi:hypothetical protein
MIPGHVNMNWLRQKPVAFRHRNTGSLHQMPGNRRTVDRYFGAFLPASIHVATLAKSRRLNAYWFVQALQTVG